MTTKQLALVALMATGVVACQENKGHSGDNKLKSRDTINATVTSEQDITVVPFQPEGGGWGFDIKIGPKTRIHQEFIPVILGRIPFATKEDALKVGENMAQKMRTQHTGFPDITRQELLDMHIAGVK
ncbi:MAG: hypothetical protein H6Q26_2502 [Bacteroidetes bacterium]|uniref:DUF4907 domain-containing protein n=1 Tax=Chitinophaga TaxID=79328 RepID=UPI0009CD1064|nr:MULTISPECIES: DUF4907 domain-containing protein [Chitinophaga]MBP1652345.1 hypothetical protein [Bacteroidota bacterium]OMP80402.1 hypothetical protein BW716_04570 [[Flexibacter] sp. ATCC 35208]WPQ65297.1 DUF4907 domain-containing protein [Chitinophaga sancti]WPV69776.1 DUF4907 domain-containing protein [Chitinophaga sp. LS1]